MQAYYRGAVNIVPAPARLVRRAGRMALGSAGRVVVGAASLAPLAEQTARDLSGATAGAVRMSALCGKAREGDIRLLLAAG